MKHTLFALFVLPVLCSVSFGAAATIPYALIPGTPSAPQTSDPFSQTLLLGRESLRNSGSEQLPFYNDPDSFTVRYRLLQSSIPVRIVSRSIQPPATGILLYRFVYKSSRVVARYTRKTRKKSGDVFEEYGPYSLEHYTSNLWHTTPWQWQTVPLNVQKYFDCVLPLPDCVSCNKEVWDASTYIIKSPSGEYCVYSSAKTLRLLNDNLELDADDREFTVKNMIGNISSYAFPFTYSTRHTQSGVAGAWSETEFPVLSRRPVFGNELPEDVQCDVLLLTPDGIIFSQESEPRAGTASHYAWSLLQNIPGIDRDWLPDATVNTKQRSASLADIVSGLASYCVQQPSSPQGRTTAEQYLKINRNLKTKNPEALKDDARMLFKCGALSKQLVSLYLSTLPSPTEKTVILQGLLKKHPHTACLYECLARVLLEQKKWRRAIQCISQWRQLEPENINADLALYQAATGSHRQTDARQALGRIVERALHVQLPRLPELSALSASPTFIQGLLHEKAGAFQKAQAAFRQCIQDQQTNCAAHLAMARVSMALLLPDAVVFHCRHALAVQPGHPEALRLLVLSYGYKGKLDDALTAYAALTGSLVRVMEERLHLRDWQNVWSLAEFTLQDMVSYLPAESLLFAVRMKVLALIKMERYEEAAAELYTFGRDQANRPQLSDLWALLYSAFNEDPHVVVISKTPLDWNERALSVLRPLLSSPDVKPSMYLMTALLALKSRDDIAACDALMQWYECDPSAWLARWIADVCLQIDEPQPGRPIDHNDYKTFLEAALSFYVQAGSGIETPGVVPPMTYIGLSRAYRRNNQEGMARYSLAKCRDVFPGFPELWREELEDTFAPEAPCSQTNIVLLSTYLRYRPNDCALFERLIGKLIQKQDIELKIDLLARWSRTESEWPRILHPWKQQTAARNSSIVNEALPYTRAEIINPTRVFTVKLHPNYEMELNEHTTIVPLQSVPWYALRSRYSFKDLRHGITRWWRLVSIGNSAAYHSIYSNELSLARKRTSTMMIDGLMRRFEWLPDTPEHYYWYEGKYCFYQRGKARRTMQPRATAADAFYDAFSPLHFGIPYDRRSLPEQLRPCFVPPEAMRVLWQESLSQSITFGDLLNWQPARLCSFWAMPRDNSLLTWMPPMALSNAAISAENILAASGTIFHCQASVPSNTSFSASTDRLTLTPLPFRSSWTSWPDEGIRLLWEHTSPTSSCLKVYIKSYRREHGIENNGTIVREYSLPACSYLRWELTGKEIRMMPSGSETAYSLAHVLSPFAWKNGVFSARETHYPDMSDFDREKVQTLK